MPSKFDEEITKLSKGKKKKLRNLAQYKNLTDEEFEDIMAEKALNDKTSGDFEERIQKKWAEFDQDYDLSDMKINDKDTLRALIQAHLTLEDYEQYIFELRSSGLSGAKVVSMDKIHKAMSELRSDISRLNADLNITRKSRKKDQDVSLQAYIDGLKEKAKKFYESKMTYIFCPKCSMLLGTFWVLYGDEQENRIVLRCNRVNDDGTTCEEKVVVNLKELIQQGGTNKKEVTPESML